MPDVHVVLECTLKDFYCGARKEVSYERQVVGLDGRTLSQEINAVQVFVRPGMKEGTEFTFAAKGNEATRGHPSDLYVKLATKVDPCCPYKRLNDNDLLYEHRASLVDILGCKPVEFLSLDQRKLMIALDQVTSPCYAKQVVGEGMPIYSGLNENCAGRGNLYIKFNVSFPKTLSKH